MNKRRLVATILSSALIASALPGLAFAQDEVEVVPQPAEGVEWQLGSYLSGGILIDVPADVDVTLLMTDGDASGSAGCNSYFGSYVIDATGLVFPGPFGSTQKFCEGTAQEVEDAYLPLLGAVAGWTIDEAGMLVLTGSDGEVSLVYAEATVDITATDVEVLIETLDTLQAQIDLADMQITTLNEEFSSVNVSKLRNRIVANEEAIVEINATIGRFRNRITANEEAIVRIDNTLNRFRDRIKALEETDAQQDARIKALEDEVGVPTPTSR